MTNLDAMIMTNNGIGGTIHQFARALGVTSSYLSTCSLYDLAEEKKRGDFESLKQSSFLRQAIMNQRSMVISGAEFTSKFDILEGIN